mmetsp:Transcript_3631/g.7099  ORF Transcript_3631/g.7099 Transcript_3631/m.7099 type:complete len:145 (+) Transcript_3631:136-570(+)
MNMSRYLRLGVSVHGATKVWGARPPPCFLGRALSDLPGFDSDRKGTADLCDIHHPDSVDEIVTQKKIQIMQPVFRDFGGVKRFSGPASTVKCFENNPTVRQALEEEGQGRVLVVDGGGSMRCALLGDNLALAAIHNGWAVIPSP